MTEDVVAAAERLAIEAVDLVRVARAAEAARQAAVAWPERAYLQRVSVDGLRTKIQGIVGRTRAVTDAIGRTA